MKGSLIDQIIKKTRLNGRSAIAFSGFEGSMVVNITNGKHMWITDEPPNYEGNDLGPNPVEMLMGSLAACTIVTVIKKSKEIGINIGTIAVSCSYTRLLDSKNSETSDETTWPQRVKVIKSISLLDITDPELLKTIKSFADNCPVESILTSQLQINTEFTEIIKP
jgi:putative redox protein